MTPETLLGDLVEYTINNPGKVGTAAGTLATVGAHYKKTGRVPIGRLPFRALQDAWGELADQWFGKQRPRGVPGLLVDVSPDDFDVTLREQAHFEGVDDASYEYTDEFLNHRRPAGLREHPETGNRVPMELHPRTFRTSDGRLLVITHLEASRSEAWGAHYRGTLLSWTDGRAQMASVLDDLGISYEEIESERAAEVTVEPPQK